MRGNLLDPLHESCHLNPSTLINNSMKSESESHLVVSNSLGLHGLYSPGQNTKVGSLSLLQGIFPTQGSEPRSTTLQADSLPAEPQGKPKNPGVGSLSLLQQIFPTQESNRGLLHCRQILYQLNFAWGAQTTPLSFHFDRGRN